MMDGLKDKFHVRAVNLYGYGRTPPWSLDTLQTLDDQASLVETALPINADPVYLAGHCFGGSVAMKLAARLSDLALARAKVLEQRWWEDVGQNCLTDKSFQGSLWSRSMAARFPHEWRETANVNHGVQDCLGALLSSIDGKSRGIPTARS
jgi:pimeloyl-ACP methyl ester carboxylesterase